MFPELTPSKGNRICFLFRIVFSNLTNYRVSRNIVTMVISIELDRIYRVKEFMKRFKTKEEDLIISWCDLACVQVIFMLQTINSEWMYI